MKIIMKRLEDEWASSLASAFEPNRDAPHVKFLTNTPEPSNFWYGKGSLPNFPTSKNIYDAISGQDQNIDTTEGYRTYENVNEPGTYDYWDSSKVFPGDKLMM